MVNYQSYVALANELIIAELDEVQPNGKMFKKYQLGDYRWISFEDMHSSANYFGRGLRNLGLAPRQNLCIFADTRAEWMIAAQAAFKQAFPVATLYTNLGEEAVVHGLNQTQVKSQKVTKKSPTRALGPYFKNSLFQATHVITSHELLPKFKNILTQTPSVTTVVYFEHQIKSTNTVGFPENVVIVPFYDVVHMGRKLAKDESVAPLQNTQPALC